MKRLQQSILLFTLLFISTGAFAQMQSNLDVALRHLEDNQKQWGLTTTDLQDLKISDHVYSKVGEIDHYYFTQRYNGVDVYNAVTAVHVAEGKVKSLRHNFISDLENKINTTVAQYKEADAVKSVFQDLEISAALFDFTPKYRADGKVTFDKGNVSNVDITVKPMYQKVGDNDIRLAWDVTLDPVKNADYWSIRVDANDGSIIDKANFTLYCSFASSKDHTSHSAQCTDHNHEAPLVKTTTAKSENISSAALGGTYNVFGEVVDGVLYMHESPVHGGRNMLTGIEDPNASPFGWHDVDGVDGPEFTTTRGNNVHAYLDVNDDNSPDAGTDVDGGEELMFDFPWTDLENPENSEGSAVSNLFVMNNYIHDFTFAYGFDESAGNFQQTNYTNQGQGNDQILAEAQDGRDLHYDAPDTDGHVNNATFATVADGVSGRMTMFIWNRTGGRLLTILEPMSLGGRYTTSTATYGPLPLDAPIESAELALAFDEDVQSPTFSCGEIVADVAGKIAVIDRGGCFFQTKTQNAEDAGAIAVIVCNFEDATINMGAGDGAPFPTIPSVMMEKSDCDIIKTAINNGQTITVSLGADGAEGADFYDGDVDNGIIAHEYGHGVSNRLVGGPNNTSCLFNNEQMGEGWSDFYTLVSTVKPGDAGTDRSGIGTYVSRETSNGNGIRSNPYSTDLSIDPETFEDLPSNQGVHALGAVWNSMLWDLYWDLVDEHGFDNDLLYGEGGNNIAVRLVTEGMKFTACNPGFVDGRDGILEADNFLYNGENNCLIWKTFARRGLGESADQGSTDDPNDGSPDFNAPAGCIKEVKLEKRLASNDPMADVVDPGGAVAIELVVRNDKDELATEVVLTESIPAGATITDISNDGAVMGDNVVWNLGTLETGQEMTITYTINVDPNNQSETLFLDDLEANVGNWVSLSDSATDPSLTANEFVVGGVGDNNGLGVFSGNAAYFIGDPAVESRENLILLEEIDVQGDNPGLRFFQNFNTETGADGVLVQISTDGEIWSELPDEAFIKNGYPRAIQFGTFVIPFLSAYSGNSNGWIDTWIDLSDYQGQIVFIRFRFGSDDNTEGVGYAMDNFEYLDIVRYNTTTVLTTAENDLVERDLPNGGILVNSDGTVAVDDANNPSLEFNIYPNPASETVNININNLTANNAQLSVYNYGGQLIEERKLNLNAGSQLERVNVSNYPTGFYFFRLTTDRGVATEKVMVGK